MTHRNHASIGSQVTPMSAATRYEIIEESERPGGFAGYKVRHVLLDSLLLLTALPDEVAGDAQRLARVGAAVRAAGRLRHDHVVPVLDLVEEDGRYFIVESFVDGVPLDRVVATCPLEAPDALHVARQLADALAYAHAAGVFHGTVSPANILIENGSPPRASLSGFALAALAGGGSSMPAPFLPYAAPERLCGQAPDACADVFAVGQVLFELFERRPFLCGSRAEIEALLRDGAVSFLPRFSRMVPAGLSGLVARTIRRSAAERQREMAHVRGDLDACLRSFAERSADAPEVPVAPPADSPAPAPAVVVRIDRPAESASAAAASRNRAAEQGRAARGSALVVKQRRPATMPARVGQRSLWPVRARREATFPSRILVRVSGPRRTSLGGKLLMGCATVALGWALLPFAMPSPARRAPVEPVVVPEPVAAATDASTADVPAEPAVTPAEPPPIERREPASDQVSTASQVWATGRDAEHHVSVGTGKRGVRRWAVPVR